MRTLLVGIAGGTGSGKSWLADFLAERLPGLTARFQEDWYYLDNSGLDEAAAARLNFDHPAAIETPALLRDLDALRAGHAVRTPKYDYATHARLAEATLVEPAPVILLDGLFVLHRPALRRRLDIGVFVDVPADVRLIRRLRRDIDVRRIPAEETLRLWESFVHPMHERFVAPSARHATHLWRPKADAAFPRRLCAEIKRRAAARSSDSSL
jgi:uridine kinase